ncbi:MAG: hypothetical protein JSV25_01260 [Spirochaetota bacterium]|nr:MAG: hypothetical protein JSV25_01260 [Spirochaetota bacterium]
MFREEDDSFLVTDRVETLCIADLFERSDERMKIFMITGVVGAFDSCDTL